MVEKPDPVQTRLIASVPRAIIGRYLLTPSIWPHLEQQHSASGEIRLIDALKVLQNEEPIYAVEMTGAWLDTGTLEGMQKATERMRRSV